MYIELENNAVVAISEIVDSIFRTSLEPIPCTFEAVIRLNEKIAPYLLDGKVIRVGKFRTPVKIVLVEDSVSPVEQKGAVIMRKITALHENSSGIAQRLGRAVIRENVSLSEIYQACGGKSQVAKDFKVSRFYCYKGYYPSEMIVQSCQDGGGVIRLNVPQNSIEFWRVRDLFNQKKVGGNLASADFTFRSGFLERHELPIYVSTKADGSFSKSNFSGDKSRKIIYVPQKNIQELNARSDVLMNAKHIPTKLMMDINAGDLIEIGGTAFIVITAAHRISQTDGRLGDSSDFWLGVKS